MFSQLIPLIIIRAYRHIPGRWRSSLGGPPSSYIALQFTERGGNGWVAIWRWCIKPFLLWFAGYRTGGYPERGGPSWSDPRDT
jgi:hypothetical protein